MTENERMTKDERLELSKLVRIRMKVVRNEIEQRKAELLADVEAQLAARYPMHDRRWADVTDVAQEAVKQADKLLAQKCRDLGIPEEFRPQLQLCWSGRGENGDKDRCRELRTVAERKLEAAAGAAKLSVDRAEADALTTITKAGLSSKEAINFISSLPTVEKLLAPVTLAQLEAANPPRVHDPYYGLRDN